MQVKYNLHSICLRVIIVLMKERPFRKPGEITKEKTAPFSGRIKQSAKDILEDAATKEGLTVGYLMGRILEDYADWLRDTKKK